MLVNAVLRCIAFNISYCKTQRLDLLNIYSLFVPSQVEAEILIGIKKKYEDVKLITEYLEQRKIKPIKSYVLKRFARYFLGDGEKSVISLAVKEKIERVLIDESKARAVARFNGLKPKGTLGLLWDSYKAENIDRKTLEVLSLELIEKGYQIKEELIVEFLKKIKELD